ncbi:MAG: SxtJ family membrane protein [bacterium]|nr:SxtJ family membrane protein [bacterium]MDI1337142.1 SxtJ family membrane protein [Lacunisphaera sp.]
MSLIHINSRPAARQLLVFAAAWLVFVGMLGLMQWAKARPAAALVCWILAAGVPAVGAVWREGLRLLYVGLSYATYPIGWVVSTIVLGVIYYAVLTPIGLILRVCGHDPLQRRADRRAVSYWHKRPGPRPPASYFRQH